MNTTNPNGVTDVMTSSTTNIFSNLFSSDSHIESGLLSNFMEQETSGIIILQGHRLIIRHLNKRGSHVLQLPREISI